MASARYFDGVSAARYDVTLSIEAETAALRIAHADFEGGAVFWPLADVRALAENAQPDQLVLSLRASEAADSDLIGLARLTVDDAAFIEDLRSLCPDLTRREVPKGTGMRIAKRAGLAVGAIVLMVFVILPRLSDTLAGLIPVEREVAYGKTVVAQVERVLRGGREGGLACSSPEGDAALAAMTERLTQGTATEYPLEIRVFDHGMINALAAPGGQIVILRGLLTAAKSAEEVAAVLAHEIGHVEARDPTRGALRAAGSAGLLSLVLGDFTGGAAAVAATEYVINAAYTREAEAEADVYALNMLTAANVDASGMADFFDRLYKREGGGLGLPEYLSSHPALQSRAERAREIADAETDVTPILTEAQWTALQNICAKEE